MLVFPHPTAALMIYTYFAFLFLFPFSPKFKKLHKYVVKYLISILKYVQVYVFQSDKE